MPEVLPPVSNRDGAANTIHQPGLGGDDQAPASEMDDSMAQEE